MHKDSRQPEDRFWQAWTHRGWPFALLGVVGGLTMLLVGLVESDGGLVRFGVTATVLMSAYGLFAYAQERCRDRPRGGQG